MNLVVAGDFSPMNRVSEIIKKGDFGKLMVGGGNFEKDVFVLNFETTLKKESCKKISKVGPHLCTTDESIGCLNALGVKAVTLANNHTFDYGKEGLSLTIDKLVENGIQYVGAGRNQTEAQKTLYLKQGNETVAIINCCEHEFSYAEDNKAGTNALNPINQYYAIQDACKSADYVVIIVHGGHEFFNLPSVRMQETYRFFIDAGADAVINHHQHCFSGYEKYKGKPIYYGIGNFCFDWPGKKSTFYTGYCVRLNLAKEITTEEIPYTQCKEEPNIIFHEFEGFRKELNRLNAIIKDSKTLQEEVSRFYISKENDCKGVLSPISNSKLNALMRRGILPSLISENKKLMWKAYVDCESHRDTMLHYLKQ